MVSRWLLSPKALLAVPLLLIFVLAVACGDDATPTSPAAQATATATSPDDQGSPTATASSPDATATPLRDLPTPSSVAPEATPTAMGPGDTTMGVQGGHYSYLNYAYAELWDPHLAGTLAVTSHVGPLYNQLTEFNPVNPPQVICDLCERWETSDDGLEVTFFLRENMVWADGEEINAEDVHASIVRMIEPGAPRPRTGLLRTSIDRSEVVDNLTIKVFLKYPAPDFLPLLAVEYMKIMPEHLIAAGTDLNDWNNIVEGGPYLKKENRRGDFASAVRNPNYFKEGLPFFDEITVFSIQDPGTAVAAFKAGELQGTTGATTLGVDDVLKLAEDLEGEYTLFWTPMTADEHFFANAQKEPWTDRTVINALRLATDQQEFKDAIGEGLYSVGAPFPVGGWYGHKEDELGQFWGYGGIAGAVRTKEEDIAKAVELLADAGFDPPSELGQIELLTSPTIWFTDLAQLWAQQLRRNLDLDIVVKVVDTPTHVKANTAGDFELSVWGYGVNINDPNDFVNAIYGPGTRNYSKWDDPEFFAMFDQQARETDIVKRTAILREMELILLENLDREPYVQVEWVPWFFFMSDKIRTEAGQYVAPETVQTILKWEHLWFEE